MNVYDILLISTHNLRAYNPLQVKTTKNITIRRKRNFITLKATLDLLVFLILTALLTCFPGSSSKEIISKKKSKSSGKNKWIQQAGTIIRRTQIQKNKQKKQTKPAKHDTSHKHFSVRSQYIWSWIINIVGVHQAVIIRASGWYNIGWRALALCTVITCYYIKPHLLNKCIIFK